MPPKKKEKTIGEIISQARRISGLSLRTVAARIPINYSYLSDIEKNRRSPSEKVIKGLCQQEELNLDFDYLMAYSGRLGEEVENYLKEHPLFGSLIRDIARENFTDTKLRTCRPPAGRTIHSTRSSRKRRLSGAEYQRPR